MTQVDRTVHNLTFWYFCPFPPHHPPFLAFQWPSLKKMTLVEHRGYLAFPGASTLCAPWTIQKNIAISLYPISVISHREERKERAKSHKMMQRATFPPLPIHPSNRSAFWRLKIPFSSSCCCLAIIVSDWLFFGPSSFFVCVGKIQSPWKKKKTKKKHKKRKQSIVP